MCFRHHWHRTSLKISISIADYSVLRCGKESLGRIKSFLAFVVPQRCKRNYKFTSSCAGIWWRCSRWSIHLPISTLFARMATWLFEVYYTSWKSICWIYCASSVFDSKLFWLCCRSSFPWKAWRCFNIQRLAWDTSVLIIQDSSYDSYREKNGTYSWGC